MGTGTKFSRAKEWIPHRHQEAQVRDDGFELAAAVGDDGMAIDALVGFSLGAWPRSAGPLGNTTRRRLAQSQRVATYG